MLRFIIGCMVVVVIAVASVPAMQAINGIMAEHDKSMEVASRYSKEAVAEIAMEQNDATAEDLNNLATAAGGDETKDYGTEEIVGGFANSGADGFSDPVVKDPVDNELQ